jgi:hypothetical protein
MLHDRAELRWLHGAVTRERSILRCVVELAQGRRSRHRSKSDSYPGVQRTEGRTLLIGSP